MGVVYFNKGKNAWHVICWSKSYFMCLKKCFITFRSEVDQHVGVNQQKQYCINTVLCLIKVNSKTIELTAHTSCYCAFDLLCVSCKKCAKQDFDLQMRCEPPVSR